MNGYHHGDLRRAVIEQALAVVAQQGPAALSLRAIASDLGVSHTAPRHHFGSSTGLLTAIAIEGFQLLRERLVAVRLAHASFLDLGVAYVEFAVAHPGHFAVMFQPTLLDQEDAALAAAADDTFAELRGGVEAIAPGSSVPRAAAVITAAWSLMHGLATLELTGNLERSQIREMLQLTDISEIARCAGALLSGSVER